jgi:voltage-gated potassium channel
MTGERETQSIGSNAYDMFIFVMTVLSLVIMVRMLFPMPDATRTLLQVYDNVICVVFLVDFGYRLATASSRRQYFIKERGWLDLLGSIPTLGGAFKFAGLLRLARLSRLARITRLMRGQRKKELIDDVLSHRSEYAVFITLGAAFLVLVLASVMVLTFESRVADSSITTGGDALWWSVVTITTVGYGDFYPVTAGGRIVAFVVMLAGVGIIGSLASILASVLVAPTPESEAEADTAAKDAASHDRAVVEELQAIRAELTALRASITPEPSE